MIRSLEHLLYKAGRPGTVQPGEEKNGKGWNLNNACEYLKRRSQTATQKFPY